MSLRQTIERWTLLAALVALPGLAQAASKTVKMELKETAEVAGQSLAPGDYKISWTGDSEAEVTVSKSGKVVAQGKGHFEERPKAALADAILFRKGASGKEVLSEIQFGGKKSVLVLAAS
jgi:hypothetical protein